MFVEKYREKPTLPCIKKTTTHKHCE